MQQCLCSHPWREVILQSPGRKGQLLLSLQNLLLSSWGRSLGSVSSTPSAASRSGSLC